jgi:methionine aminopeptidase
VDERELSEIEAMAAAGGVLPGDVGRLIAKVRRLRARAVPKVVWRREGGESVADSGLCTLEVCKGHGGYWWYVHAGRSVPVMGRAHDQADGEAKAEAAFLRMVGVVHD